MTCIAAQFSEVYRFSALSGGSGLTYSLYQSDAIFREFFLVDGSSGAVYLQQPLAGRNISTTTGTVRVRVG